MARIYLCSEPVNLGNEFHLARNVSFFNFLKSEKLQIMFIAWYPFNVLYAVLTEPNFIPKLTNRLRNDVLGKRYYLDICYAKVPRFWEAFLLLLIH